ncbi:MAG: molybdopterin molybdotransferase MoeA [Gammaproteobacteria bacterium]
MVDLCSNIETRMLALDQAVSILHARLVSVSGTEKVAIDQALGRILAFPSIAPIDLPPFRNAAMDGYALASSDIDSTHPFSLLKVGTSWAGAPYTGRLSPGQCVRIFTGAPVPEGLDTVVMQEQVTTEDDSVVFPSDIKASKNIREAGEDITRGKTLIVAGKKLNIADIGLLASAGIEEVEVIRRLKVAFFSTGNELASLGRPLTAGQIYDSNRYLLKGLLNESTLNATDYGVIPDNKATLEETLLTAAQHHDLIITTGGASVGEADFVKEILETHGQVAFWKLAIKPGKPVIFGNLGNAWFFGLPGNPVAVITTFGQIVKPALNRLTGAPPVKSLSVEADCLNPIKKSPGRMEFVRGILSQTDTGKFQVKSSGSQGSHILGSFSRANCYIVLPAESQGISSGETVTVQPFGTDLNNE